jgi:hypothetical protein
MLLSEYKAKETHRVLAYGRSKTGKDSFIGQLARTGKQLWWFDLEDGIKTLLNPAILPVEFHKNIHVFRIPDNQLVPMAIETMLKVMKGAAVSICWKHGKVACVPCTKDSAPSERICLNEFGLDDWLVINSVTQLSLSAMYAVIKVEMQKDNWEYKPTFHDYRAQGFMLDRIFSLMQSGNFNCAAVSHEIMIEQIQDTAGGGGKDAPGNNVETIVPAAGTRNFSRQFGRYFDNIIYLDIVNKKHRAFSSTVHDGRIMTGTRTGIEIEKLADGSQNILSLLTRKTDGQQSTGIQAGVVGSTVK